MELFNNKIIPFNYDYYSHASVYLSMSQKQLKVD